MLFDELQPHWSGRHSQEVERLRYLDERGDACAGRVDSQSGERRAIRTPTLPGTSSCPRPSTNSQMTVTTPPTPTPATGIMKPSRQSAITSDGLSRLFIGQEPPLPDLDPGSGCREHPSGPPSGRRSRHPRDGETHPIQNSRRARSGRRKRSAAATNSQESL